MAEAAAPEVSPPAAVAGGGQKTGLLVGVTVAGAVLGLVVGLVIGPMIVARQQSGATIVEGDSTSRAEGHGAGGTGAEETAHGGAGGANKRVVELSNVIVNPAGTQGTRFLMTSVAIAVASEEAQKLLSEREVELRDRITSILESYTLAQLTMPGARDSLKARIGVAVSGMLGPKTSFRVFLPQFVIQ